MTDTITISRDVVATLVAAAVAHRSYLMDAAIRSGQEGDTTGAEFLTKMSRQFGVVIAAAKEALHECHC